MKPTQQGYTTKFGASRKGSKHIRSFSISQDNSRYLDGVTKGHRSRVVNRALDYLRMQPRESDLLSNIEGLQNVIRNLNQELDQISGSGQVANNEAKNVPQSRGIWSIFHFIRSFRL